MQTHHEVNGHRMTEPFPEGTRQILMGMGCFWGTERRLWEQPGVYSTQVGYAGGHSESPDYETVCTGQTGHAEVVRVIYDPSEVSLEALLAVFWESHDPTQRDRQGNDVGSQYRSCLYYDRAEDLIVIDESVSRYQQALNAEGQGRIQTEIAPFENFYMAEDYHQQYLAKNPNGYCGLAGTGVCYLPAET